MVRERSLNPATVLKQSDREDRDELLAYENSLKHYRDTKNVIETAALEGEAKGRAEGRTEKALEVARHLLRANLPLGLIAEATGLSEAEIEALCP